MSTIPKVRPLKRPETKPTNKFPSRSVLVISSIAPLTVSQSIKPIVTNILPSPSVPAPAAAIVAALAENLANAVAPNFGMIFFKTPDIFSSTIFPLSIKNVPNNFPLVLNQSLIIFLKLNLVRKLFIFFLNLLNAR